MKILAIHFFRLQIFCGFIFFSLNGYSQLESTDLDFLNLKQRFNNSQDKHRIVSVLGVNCPPCRLHRDDVRDLIMSQCDNPDLEWLIIWFEDPGHPAVRTDAVN